MHTDLERILSILRTTPHRWADLTDEFPIELLESKPKPGEWSAVECLYHLLEAERNVFPVRVHLILDGKDLPNYDPDQEEVAFDPTIPPARNVSQFTALRTKSLAVLSELEPVDLARNGTHAELGRVTLGELLHEWAAHDLNHTVQAERALMQFFIQRSGPWRPFFVEHDTDR